MLQAFVQTVSSIFRRMLQVFMFKWLYTYVASVYLKCFIFFKRMLQVCLSGCCNCYTYMLQAYVANVSPISDTCCRSASCCNILIGARSERMRRRSPRAQWSTRARQAKLAWMLHAHQQAWARSFTRTNMLGRAYRHSRCMPHAGNMRGSSIAVLHVG
jgi:hypothetical protein